MNTIKNSLENPLQDHLEKSQIIIGYMSLLDSAPIIWAHYRGFFEKHGLDVQLAQEVSWASLRDRLAYGALDAAQCLAPMIVAANLGADQVGVPFISALTLSENWAAISLSKKLADQLEIHSGLTPLESALKIKQYLDSGHSLILAHVFQYSMHHYLLREWLSLANINEQTADISFITVTPPQMVSKLENGMIDGFCVGEPWNTAATANGIGHIVSNAQAIMPNGADKVLGVTQEWAQQNPKTHQALVTALMEAQAEITKPEYQDELIDVLQDYEVLNLPKPLLKSALEGVSAGNPPRFVMGSSAKPKPADYGWLSLQMLRWQQWKQPISIETLTQACCDTQCFDNAYEALSGLSAQDLSNSRNQPITREQANDYLINKGWDQSNADRMLSVQHD